MALTKLFVLLYIWKLCQDIYPTELLTALVEYASVILHQREIWFLLECLGIVQSYTLVIVLYQ